jgi:hypothetical protein
VGVLEEQAMSGDHNMYGDGTVYRGERSKDSAVPTYTLQELAHAKGVPSMVTSAMLALQDKLSYALDQLAVLEPLAKRMALDLECLTLDPTSARWHDTAVESLQAYRDLMDAWYPQDHVSPLGKD